MKVTALKGGGGGGGEFMLIEFHFITSPTISVVGVNLDDGWMAV